MTGASAASRIPCGGHRRGCSWAPEPAGNPRREPIERIRMSLGVENLVNLFRDRAVAADRQRLPIISQQLVVTPLLDAAAT